MKHWVTIDVPDPGDGAKCAQRFIGRRRPAVVFGLDPFANGYCITATTSTAHWPLTPLALFVHYPRHRPPRSRAAIMDCQ